MAVALSIINEAGSAIFSNTALNPCLRAKGSVTATAFSGGGAVSVRQFVISYTPLGTVPPLCAIRATAGGAMLYTQAFSGGQWHWTFLTSMALGSTLNYFIFDKPAPVTSGVVMEIYHETTGELLWAMGSWPLRVNVPLIAGNITESPAPDVSFTDYTFTAGRTYAAIVADPAFYMKWYPAGGGSFRLSSTGESVQIIDNVIRCRGLEYSRGANTTSPNYGLERSHLGRTIMAVDVTNY